MNFIRKVFSPLILLVSVILMIYTFYKSEIIWNGTNRIFYNNYYILSIFLFFISILSFYLNQKIKDYLIMIFTSITFALYSFEIYLTLDKKNLHTQQKKIYQLETGKKYDDRSKFQVYNDLKKKNKSVSVVVPPNNFLNNTEIVPLSGISNSNTINCNENGYYFIYDSDRYGFNNPDNEWEKNNIDFLLVGDSFTQGACVNRPNDISSVLRTKFNKSSLNLGFNGNGPLLQYAGLREYLKENTKIILWFYFENNDLEDLSEELKSGILQKYLKDLNYSQNLKSKQDKINEKVFQKIKNHNELSFDIVKFIKIYNTRLAIKPKKGNELELPPEYKTILKLANELAKDNKSKLYFVYLPEYNRYINKINDKNYFLIKKMVKDLNIPLIDVHQEVFLKEKNPLLLFPFGLSGHYNVNGYKKITELIYKKVND